VLSHPAIASIAMVGDVTLAPMMLEAERRSKEVEPEEIERVLGGVRDCSSPFISMP
jgi:hypothetical protein